ncbi:MAG: FAD:protein FMN transferase [Flavobacterium sp.]|nr:MAG: FAD:protein FMN transferase [Flavobacterium sp.]
MKRLAVFLILIFGLLFGAKLQAQVLKERAVTLMGSRFDISIVAKDATTADRHIDSVIAEISRIENLISDWKAGTQIDQINRNAGIKPVKVDREVFDLVKRSIYFSEQTAGAFDISYAAMDKIWKFDGSMKSMPTADEIKKSVIKVGYKNIELDSLASTVFLKLPGMKIGFGATGKGYAADKGRELMESMGVTAGIVNASGDMATWGNPPKAKAWNVGLTNPFDENKYISVLSLKREAVVTSGSYEKYVEFDGKRYAHIINPVTGYPATGLISVTVIGPSAEIANGLSTSIMVLGAAKGMALIQSFPLYNCVLITDSGEVIKSANFKAKLKKRLK